MSGPTTLRLATINILIDRSRWPERRRLLAGGLADLGPDLIALQEVSDPLGASSAHWLAGELGGYEVLVCPKAGRGRSREGIAVLSRLPVEDHATLDLGGQRRVAQFVRIRAGGHAVVLVNGHYSWPVGAHAAQARQVGRVASLDSNAGVMICGDFNATPGSRAVALMRNSFASAHRARHGREPDFTYPTALASGGRVRRAAAGGVWRILSMVPARSWKGTLDYIFVSPGVRVVDCGVFLDRPDPEDPGLYASDHMGLAATLEVAAMHEHTKTSKLLESADEQPPPPLWGRAGVGGEPVAREFARQLRKTMTDAERRLWRELKAYRLDGRKFRRQAPIGAYIVDFVCFEARLIIELDGGQHAVQVEKDNVRTTWLESQGFRVMRFWNFQVFEEFDSVLETIRIAVRAAPSPQPSPTRGEGARRDGGDIET